MASPHNGIVLCALCAAFAACAPAEDGAAHAARAKYDPATGRLEQIEFDTTRNGRYDAVGVMHGTRVDRIEVDEDEDGKVDRWEYYDEARRLVQVGYSRRNNGLVDATAFFDRDGAIERIEISTRADGQFNRVEYYRADALARVEEDTNGDRRPDKWESYTPVPGAASGASRIGSAAFDDAFRGTPNRRFVYGAGGGVLRVEVDPDGDGQFVDAAVIAGPP
jgi:hypothetical protein